MIKKQTFYCKNKKEQKQIDPKSTNTLPEIKKKEKGQKTKHLF